MSLGKVTFGKYSGKPIEWLILSDDGFKQLLVTKEGLWQDQLHSGDGYSWYQFNLRRNLNTSFFDGCFTEEEKKRIVNTKIYEAGYTTKVNPVTTEEYGLSKAKRPFNSRLDKSKLVANDFEPLPTWQDALKRYLKELQA